MAYRLSQLDLGGRESPLPLICEREADLTALHEDARTASVRAIDAAGAAAEASAQAARAVSVATEAQQQAAQAAQVSTTATEARDQAAQALAEATAAQQQASAAALAAAQAEVTAQTAVTLAQTPAQPSEGWRPVTMRNTSDKSLRPGIWESGIPLTVLSDDSGLLTTGGNLGYFHVNEAGVYLIGVTAALSTSPDGAAQLSIYGATSFAAAGRTEEYRFHGYGNGLISGSVAMSLSPEQFLGFGMRDASKANVLPASGLRVTVARLA